MTPDVLRFVDPFEKDEADVARFTPEAFAEWFALVTPQWGRLTYETQKAALARAVPPDPYDRSGAELRRKARLNQIDAQVRGHRIGGEG